MPIDLLIVTPGFPKDEHDSTCIPPLQEYLIALRKARPDIGIAVIALEYPYTEDPYPWNGIDVHPCGGRNRRWNQLLVARRARRALNVVLRNGPVRAVHSLWLTHTAVISERLARNCRAKHVLTMMGQDARDGSKWLQRLRGDTSFVCLSQRQAGHFDLLRPNAKAVIIPWGSPIDVPRPVPAPSVDLLFVGSMLDVKRPSLFLEIREKVAAVRPVRAAMIGRGRTNAFGTTKAGFEDLGELPREEVLAHMSKARVLVHTSSYEGQGYVFDEALATGMSIASFAVGSARPEARWCVARDTSEMVHRILGLLDDPLERTSVTLHPMSNTISAYLDLYGLV